MEVRVGMGIDLARIVGIYNSKAFGISDGGRKADTRFGELRLELSARGHFRSYQLYLRRQRAGREFENTNHPLKRFAESIICLLSSCQKSFCSCLTANVSAFLCLCSPPCEQSSVVSPLLCDAFLQDT